MIIQPNRLLYVAESEGRGRGVFTKEVIPKGDMIEVCPVVILSEGYLKLLGQTELKDYIFSFPTLPGKNIPYDGSCICMGYGSLYNHSNSPNADWEADWDTKTITFYALKNIKDEEEITFNYRWPRKQLNEMRRMRSDRKTD